MTLRRHPLILGTLCALGPAALAQAGCVIGVTAGGPSWTDVRQSLEQHVLEAPANVHGRLALAQYLTYCDDTRREGVVQLSQLARDRTVGVPALESWSQSLAWLPQDVSALPLYRAYLRLRPNDRKVRAQLIELEKANVSAPPQASAPSPSISGPSQWPASMPADAVAEEPAGPLPLTAAASLAPSAWSARPKPTPPAAQAAAAGAVDTPQARLATLQEEIRDIEQDRIPEFSIGTVVRSRQGESGLSRLTDTEMPMVLKFPLGDGKVSLRVTPVMLNAGTPATAYDTLSRFGAGPASALANATTSAGSQNDAGVGLGVAYETRNWQADIGTTPLGLHKSDVTGGVRYRMPLGNEFSLDLNLSRRPVRDSVLSFAGARDARSGVVWGGVSASGGRAGLTWDDGRTGIYGYGALHQLTGSYVASNTRAEAGAGLYQHFVHEDNERLTAGVALTALGYDKNLRYFTFGHGGYFSPQEFVALSLPVEWQQRVGRLRYQVRGSVGLQYIHEDDAPYFPASAARQSAAAQAAADAAATGVTGANARAVYSGQRKTGVGYGLSGAFEYQLQSQLWLGGHLALDNARDYRQLAGGLYLRYAFQPSLRPASLPLSPLRSPYEND